ncbi:MAG: ATP-dependent DNA ligase [Actinobacteria bacterium HGW-Actinobacteria-5]|jgi:DNA ligase-1|nr:MAG: ATP-dependent DNA ligase [Actinobacteria bacterium HGW-Actinobacteria-5]
MLFDQVVQTSTRVAATSSRTAKVAALAETLAAATTDELEIVAHYLSGSLRQRRTGVGWRALVSRPEPASAPTLTIAAVDEAFAELAMLSGEGSQGVRQGLLAELLGAATGPEQAFLAGLVTGETRQGALEGLLLPAIAAAFSVPADAVRRAAMFAGSIPVVAVAAKAGGEPALAAITLQVGRPVLPMLASSAATIREAFERFGDAPVSVESKLDGIRIQVHRDGDDVAVYSRSLDDITARLPGVVAAVGALPARRLVLDGEALALRPDGRPMLFQDTASAGSVLRPFFFDLLHVDDLDLVDEPASVREARLAALVPPALRVERLVTADAGEAEAFWHEVLAAGHEGVVIKALDAGYAAGRRGAAWVKVKPVHTLDLVVLAVEWGSGRRRGRLSNIHLGARDPASGDFVMLGKTFKGMTDEMLAWQTERFLALETRRQGQVVFVRPEQVVEVAFDGVQRSTRYPGGMALRFARVVRYREDRTAQDADTVETVRSLAR